jgi:hypothetical protein
MSDNAASSTAGPLKAGEIELLAMFLDTAADEFSDKGSNDFTVPATPENKAIVSAIIRFKDPDQQVFTIAELMDEEDELFIYDYWAMAYFAQRCTALSDAARPGAMLTPNECTIVAQLLELAAEEHENISDDYSYNLTLPATPFHVGLCEGVLETMTPQIAQYVDREFRTQAGAIAAQLREQLRTHIAAAGQETDLDVRCCRRPTPNRASGRPAPVSA